VSAGLAPAVGLLADRALGEPPTALHPVAAFGRMMGRLETVLWRDSRSAGVIYAAVGAVAGVVAGAALDGAMPPSRRRPRRPATGRGSGPPTPALGPGLPAPALGPGLPAPALGPGLRAALLSPGLPATALATWLVVAGRALGDEARAIGERLAADDLDGARRRLPALVGRDPDSLDAKGVARAVVESVAENTVDAVVAPACWAAAAGAAGAGFYRAVNTLDAMVGHRNARYERFGWASARLDDAANWIPARLAGGLVAAVRPRRAREVLAAVGHPPAHPSPNAGVVEAAFAAALGLRLGGDTVYAGRVDPRPAFGTGRPPEPADIDAAVRLSRDVTLALAALLAAPAVLRSLRRHPERTADLLIRRHSPNRGRDVGAAARDSERFTHRTCGFSARGRGGGMK
jgi:adenosylcobinamide-phosphate synthase